MDFKKIEYERVEYEPDPELGELTQKEFLDLLVAASEHYSGYTKDVARLSHEAARRGITFQCNGMLVGDFTRFTESDEI